MSDEIRREMWKAGTAPNKGDYEGMPDWRNRPLSKKQLAAEKGGAARRQQAQGVTLPVPPWEKDNE